MCGEKNKEIFDSNAFIVQFKFQTHTNNHHLGLQTNYIEKLHTLYLDLYNPML